ncbi:hypothetical protein T08_16726 [Trichinella sp. T8]|nr:hypothetical protein T08_16726 [Trichinella sp. T8]
MGERVPHPGGGCSGRNETDLVGVTHPWAGADLARQGLLTPQRRQRTNQRPGDAFIMSGPLIQSSVYRTMKHAENRSTPKLVVIFAVPFAIGSRIVACYCIRINSLFAAVD